MKKRFLFPVLFLGLLGGITMFLTQNLTLYNKPEIVVQHPTLQHFQPIKENSLWQCYQNLHAIPVRQHEFRLLNWNIHKGVDNGWQQDLVTFSRDKQLVVLQEATTAQRIPTLLPQFHTSLHTLAFQFRHQQTGVFNLARLNMDRYCVNGQSEPWLRLPKVMAAMRFALDNQSLLVINVHLVNFEWKTTAYTQQLRALYELIAKHHGAVVLAGDFNAWSKERTAQLFSLTNTLGLNAVTPTPDERVTVFGYPLDYLFVRGVRVHSAQSVAVKSSDHHPVMLHFSL